MRPGWYRLAAVKAEAQISLIETAKGGLSAPLSSPCRSLILRVQADTNDEEVTNLGVQIATLTGEPLSAASSRVPVELPFSSDLADVFVVPGTRFTLRYPNRIVGRGQVVSVSPF